MTGQEPPRRPRREAGTPDCEVLLTLWAVPCTGGGVQVPARLRYYRTDPCAVYLDHPTGQDGPETRVFARDVLATGLAEPVGTGDVSVRPGGGHTPDTVFISLSARGGTIVLRAPKLLVQAFLEASWTVVPAGREFEHHDLDAVVDRLRSPGAPPAP
ncbi:SsgA family sporulation/cell division regulator [Streptomyces sp. TLI_171]|uniref:SsgA family sporulation/cell division regulator n=1 Tax=Streptomyces sp. TLI_171 TaxID=1938859 RepID=UPI000C1947E7|nr:SsgA family sporulation/cell division regulator [Streptomyces sp. TLI_171]RKE22190.1 sporulation and cell division protein SsgA [Streptomyces sp. TLI_171]